MHCNRYKQSNRTSWSGWTSRASRASRAGWPSRANRHGSSCRSNEPGSAAYSALHSRRLESSQEQQLASNHWPGVNLRLNFLTIFSTRFTIVCRATILKHNLIISCDKVAAFHVNDACRGTKMFRFYCSILGSSCMKAVFFVFYFLAPICS